MPTGPAARVTDTVAHPLPPVLGIGPGSRNIMIGFLPAWRGIPAAAAAAIQSAKAVSDAAIKTAEAASLAASGTPAAPAAKAAEEAAKAAAAAAMGSMITSMAGGADIHTCTTLLPLPPHGPGVVVDGSQTVMFNNLPACRLGDTIVEAVGPPNKITSGCMQVTIGDMGGGGGGGFTPARPTMLNQFEDWIHNLLNDNDHQQYHYSPYIIIEGTPEYIAKVKRDLDIIASTPSGKKLLESMEKSGKQVRIHSDEGKGNWAWTDPAPPAGANPPGYMKTDGTTGDKANAEVGYNPDRTSITGPPGSPYNNADWAKPPNRPADVGLFHELVHADDHMNGKMARGKGTNFGPKAGQPINNSELRAAGLPPYQNEDYSENTYRKDRAVKQRDFY